MGRQQQRIWKVYFPQCCLESPSGICLGWTCTKRQLVCVLAIAQAPIIRQISDCLSRVQEDCHAGNRANKLEIVGVWQSDADNITSSSGDHLPCAKMECDFIDSTRILRLHQLRVGDIPLYQMEFRNEDDTEATNQNILFVLYDQRQLNAARTEQWSTHLYSANKQTHGTHHQGDDTLTDIEWVCQLVQGSFTNICALQAEGAGYNDSTITCNILPEKSRTCWSIVVCLIWQLICLQLRAVLSVVNVFANNRIYHSKAVQWLLRFPATCCQLIQRFSTLQRLLDTDYESRRTGMEWQRTRVEAKHLETEIKQRRGNLLGSIAVDVCLGIVLMLWLQHNNIPKLLADLILVWTNTTGEHLQQLLQWLMGNPAGLKLNSPLAHLLGHFFLYHVYLWIGYLTVIGPFLSMLIWCMALSGCLGLSVLLSVASDMLSILTFHIYCFYVYAAKIYSMQMSGLLSLSRLFRGKKWNVLRRRVDSCSYDKDQLFIGTLLFTMLLFLLPTTALFYAVFTMLRLLVLIVQSLLTRLIHLLDTLPVFSLILWASQSDDTLTDGVEFHVKEQHSGRPPYLIMHVQSMSLSRVIQIGLMSFYDDNNKGLETQAQNTLLDHGKNLLRGHLIYPWGGERREKTDI